MRGCFREVGFCLEGVRMGEVGGCCGMVFFLRVSGGNVSLFVYIEIVICREV